VIEHARIRRLVVGIAAVGLLLYAAYGFVARPGEPDLSDIWPLGSIEDIASLSHREDVNVLFVLIDTLRSDRLGTYGYPRDTSPILDRMAAQGVRFARQLSQSSWTKASMASLWTGVYPTRTGITRFDDIVPPEAVMPAEVFKSAGFRTIGLYRNGWVAPTFGFDQGFEVYTRPPPLRIPAEVRRENPTLSARGTDEGVVQAAVEFLRVNPSERWFLYLHLMDLHEYTYDAESARFGGSYSDIYDSSIRWTDGTLDLLLRQLADLGQLSRTLVVIASDHGEAFRERGFEGHARHVYRETTEVPLYLLFPFRLEPGIVVTTRTRNIDIWPTVYELLGLPLPLGIDGRSRVPEILAAARGEELADAEVMALAHLDQHWGRRDTGPQPTIAVLDGELRYVKRIVRGRVVEQLYDARGDPAELNDLASSQAETVARLRDVAEQELLEEPIWGEPESREIGELELNQLRALGYAIP
jgi:arylsulfatase A-like enzyme